MNILYAVILILISAISWLGNLVGLPGNWGILVATAVYAYFVRDAGHWEIGLWGVIGVACLAILGEVLELIAGALGAYQRGSSIRGALLGIVGSFIGGILGIFIGLPVPIFGSIIAAVLFAGLGAFAGSVLGEVWLGASWKEGVEVGKTAFVGRLIGTFAKLYTGCLILVLVLALLIW